MLMQMRSRKKYHYYGTPPTERRFTAKDVLLCFAGIIVFIGGMLLISYVTNGK